MSAEDRDLAPVPEPSANGERNQTQPSSATSGAAESELTPRAVPDPVPEAAVPAESAAHEVGHKVTPPPPRERAGIGIGLALALAIGGSAVPFLFMALDRRLGFSVPVSVISLAVSAFGVLAALRSFDRPRTGLGASLTLGGLAWPLGRWVASLALVVVALRLAVAGRLPYPEISSGILVTAAVFCCALAFFKLGKALGAFEGNAASDDVFAHSGFWLVALNCALHLPMLGNFGLIDPWETHYGEVAREIVARDDWISLWWAQDGWFWSKPILNFWVQALSFKVFGVGFMPGEMLADVARGAWPQPEWACRFGVFVATTIADYTLYKALVRPFGRRTALLGAAILATCPYWFMLERQTMADMVYVAPLTTAMGLLLLAFQADPEQSVRSLELRIGQRKVWVSGAHLLFLCILLTALPQVLYLFSRNLTLHTSVDLSGFRPHWDEFMQGSGGGNCGQPGNQACASKTPLYGWAQPIYAGLVWLAIVLGVVWWNRHERRLQRLLFLAAWYATAIAVMGKGAPGLVIPLATALAFPIVQGRFRDYLRMELVALVALVLVVALPWYVQMYIRHGWPFLDRLIMHDMVRRAFVHVHDTNAGDDVSFRYYLWQLGYGLFPWTGFAAAGIAWLARSREDYRTLHNTAGQFLLIWWLVAFGMFTITLTKFHHYILPLVPPTAMLAGVVVAQYLPKQTSLRLRKDAAIYLSGMALAALSLVLGIQRFFPGRISGVTPGGQPAAPTPLIGAVLVLVGLGIAGVLVWRSERRTEGSEGETLAAGEAASGGESEGATPAEDNGLPEASSSVSPRTQAILAAVALACSGAVYLAGRDQFTTNAGDIEGQGRILHLFTYNYARSWPEVLDFKSVFLAFTLLFTGSLIGLAWRRFGRHFLAIFCATAVWYAAWCVDLYFVQVSPHWGQRETLVAYYTHRKDENEPLIAYQMNWKGENFYTGNKMATFVSTGAKFKSWIKSQRGKGISTFFVTTEHSRISAMKRELEAPDSVELMTTKELNDKFVLAKVVFPPLAQGNGGEAAGGEDEPESADKPGSLE